MTENKTCVCYNSFCLKITLSLQKTKNILSTVEMYISGLPDIAKNKKYDKIKDMKEVYKNKYPIYINRSKREA